MNITDWGIAKKCGKNDVWNPKSFEPVVGLGSFNR